MDTARCSYLMELLLRNQKPVLFVGPTGTGKSIYVKDKIMNQLPQEEYLPMFLNFSAQTTADQTQVNFICIHAIFFRIILLIFLQL